VWPFAVLGEGSLQLSLLDEQNLMETQSPEYPGERLMVCYNELLAEERQRRDPVLPASNSESAQVKKLTHQTVDGLPVQSFATLLSDLASRARV
jgi:hypothetical protein